MCKQGGCEQERGTRKQRNSGAQIKCTRGACRGRSTGKTKLGCEGPAGGRRTGWQCSVGWQRGAVSAGNGREKIAEQMPGRKQWARVRTEQQGRAGVGCGKQGRRAARPGRRAAQLAGTSPAYARPTRPGQHAACAQLRAKCSRPSAWRREAARGMAALKRAQRGAREAPVACAALPEAPEGSLRRGPNGPWKRAARALRTRPPTPQTGSQR